MDFFEVVKKRRSIRQFTDKKIPDSVIKQAFEAAILAPNSSNTQTWDFYIAKKAETKKSLVQACLNQSAARTAAELVVVVASPKTWKRSQPELVKWVERVGAPAAVKSYYQRLVPAMYRWGYFNSLGLIKWISFFAIGLFRPIMRSPTGKRSIQEVAIKSAALAAENFVLAIAAQGYASCMMEGFDESRVRRLLKLSCSDRVVMVNAVGEEGPRGLWGDRFRLPLDQVVHEV